MTSLKTTTTPDAMRAEADQLAASVREDSRSLLGRQRKAAQLRWEAGLIEDRDLCLAALTGARGFLSRLKAAVAPAADAKHTAEDKRDAEKAHRDLRVAEEQRADADPAASAEEQEDAGIRTRKAQRRLDLAQAALDDAEAAHEKAKAAVKDQAAYVADLEREHAEADRKARNPGTAPDAPGARLGVSGISDLDDDQRRLMTAVVLLMAQMGTPDPAPAAPPGNPFAAARGWSASRDPSAPQLLTQPDGRVLIAQPPARRP